MSKFITGKELEDAIYDIIWGAENNLLIVSPFIKLDDYFKRLFDHHLNNPKLHILVVFGKNEGEINKSLSKNDIDYFKRFLNISIVYVPNLHAKYYGNEQKGVITSINLYDYSFKNNIEFGVYSEQNFLNKFTGNADIDAWQTCFELAEENEAIYIKRPVFEKKLLSSILGKNYIKSDVLFDNTQNFQPLNRNKGKSFKTINDFPDELELGSEPKTMPTRAEIENPSHGFCIRTGEKINFNVKKPYSYQAYTSWAYYGNADYPEKFCHKTGKPSYGKTSMRKPIL